MISPRLAPRPIADLCPAASAAPDLRALATVQRFIREWTTPELFLGMGLGHLGWGAGRLLGLRGAISFGATGRAALWSGRVAGVGSEAASWTAAGQVGRWFRGGSNHDFASLGGEWAATGATAASLRLAQGMFRGGGAWGLLLGSYGGLVLSERGLALAGLTEDKRWSESLGDAAGALALFQGAGLLARGLWGPALTGMDHAFALRTQQLLAARGGFGAALPSFGPEPLPNHFAMAMDSKTSQGGSRGRNRTAPAPGSGEQPRDRIGTRPYPWRLGGPGRLIREISSPQGQFRERIMEDHVYFLLPSAQSFSPSRIEALLNRLDYLPQIPTGRKIQVLFQDEAKKFNFVKFDKTFFMKQGTSFTPPQDEMRPVLAEGRRFSEASRSLAGVYHPMGTVISRPTHGPDPASPVARSFPPLRLVGDAREISEHLRSVQSGSGGIFTAELLVNRRLEVLASDLFVVNDLIKTSPAGSRVLVHDPQRRRTFSFENYPWALKADTHFWQVPDFQRLEPQSLLEAMQHLSFLRPFNTRGREPVVLRFRGGWRPLEHGNELEKFLNVQLPLPFRPIQVRQGPYRQDFRFDPEKKHWSKGPWE
jgi:hypothetical protein